MTLDEQTAARRAARELAGKRQPNHPEPSTFDAEEITTPSGKRVKVTDEELAIMLEKAGGFRSRVAKQLGVSTSAISHRVKRSKYLTETVKTIEEAVLDLAEAMLIQKAREGEAWAVTFILKCKGRKRGWIERQDIAFGNDPEALPPPIVLPVHDTAFVEAERERQKREFAEVVDAAMIEMSPDTSAALAELPGMSGPTAQPLDGGSGNGATDAPLGGNVGGEQPKSKDVAVPKPKHSPAPRANPKADDGPEVEESGFAEYLVEPVAEPPETETGAAQGAPGGHEAQESGKKPEAPQAAQARVPRTPSEAAAMMREAERRNAEQKGSGNNGEPGKFRALPAMFPRK